MWKDYLSFTRREQKGLVVLIVIIVLLVLFRIVFPLFLPTSDIQIVKLDSLYFTYQPNNIPTKQISVNDEISYFDPNNVTVEFLIGIGINQRVAKNWHNYLLKGGSFTKPEEILKVYGMDSSLLNQLLPYVKISKTISKEHNSFLSEIDVKKVENQWNIDSLLIPINSDDIRYVKKSYVPDFKIEINSADTSEWMLLKGIGTVLSNRIVNYRKKLGGFVSTNQLLEVYGIKQEVVDNNIHIMTVDTAFVVPININIASIGKLREHPYMDFYKAQAIVEHRKTTSFKNSEEVLKLEPFANVDWNILKFYLSVENK